ncbi:MAG: uncharacterized protein QOD74_3016 [Variibacter sp.]|nr:uncharacterized protein [Variibacter sp.]
MLARTNDLEFDTGPGSRRAGTDRYCAVIRSVKPVAEMIRFVAGPDGVVPDLKRKLPGRGVWVTASRTVLSDAIRRKVFARPFGQEVRVPAELVALTEQLLERAALDALAIAGKARLAVSGFSKVEAALTSENVVALIHAADAAPDGVRKLTGAALRRIEDAGIGLPVIQAFKSAQLDLALGRSNVVHAALLAGRASATLLARSVLLARFREDGSGREHSLLCPEVRGLGSE